MTQQRKKRKTRYLLGLLLLLCLGILVASVGTTLARYYAERQVNADFQVREPEKISLGMVVDGVFTPTNQLAWKTQGGVTSLQFAIANGTTEADYSARDQKMCLRMIGTLGIWTGDTPPDLSVSFLSEKTGEEITVTATASPIAEGTALYHTYGQGWIYTFLEQSTQELSWVLPGGALSYIALTVTVQGETVESPSLLQPLVVAEAIGK